MTTQTITAIPTAQNICCDAKLDDLGYVSSTNTGRVLEELLIAFVLSFALLSILQQQQMQQCIIIHISKPNNRAINTMSDGLT